MYDPKRAHQKARIRRQNAKFQGKKVASSRELRNFVEYHLLNDQSPENIAGRLKYQEKELPYVSKNSIYRYVKSVYGRRIEYLRSKNRHSKRRRYRKRKELNNRTFIDERPKVFGNRTRFGHVEADFIVSGKKGKDILLVVVCRRSRYVLIEKISKITIENIHLSFVGIKKRFPELKSITTDNDILFRKHEELSKLLIVPIYFCHPYRAWEKGSVENVNWHIRRYIPKGSNISQYSKKHTRKIEDKLNNRILKCLNFLTPTEKVERYRQRNKKTDSTNSN